MGLDQEIHLRDYLYVLRKRRTAILLFFFSVLIFVLTLTLFEKVLYKASASVLIERENPNVVDFKEVMAIDASTSDFYQTQYQMLKSESLVRDLIEKEHLEKDPYLQSAQKGFLRTLLKKQKGLESLLSPFLQGVSIEDVFIKKMLKIEPVRNSRIVEVGILHPDPERSAQIANAYTDLFIERNLKNRFNVASQATDLLSKQLFEMKDKVGEAERKLQQYKEENNLLNIPSIRKKDAFIQEAKLELVKLQSEEAKMSKRYLPAHPTRIHIRSQIEGLEERIDEAEKKNLGQGRTALGYAEFEREAESSREIYESLLRRLKETSSESKTQASNITVVDQAQVPLRPFTPRPLLNLLIGLFIGGAGSVLLAFFLEYLDSTIKIPDDVEKGLNLDLFGIIPEGRKKTGGPAQGELFLIPGEHSPISESFRALRTAILFKSRHVPGCRVYLVTSPNPGEGKTSVSMNLAQAFAQNNLKVLLIDADLRKPRIHKMFGSSRKDGLKEVLEKELSPEQAIRRNLPDLAFDFLASGEPSDHPTEILSSQNMKNLLGELRKIYDVVLLDSPPYLAVADVAVLTEIVDGIVIVARHHKTDKKHLRNFRRRFEIDPKVVGVVINQVNVREKDYYYSHYYYYGYGENSTARRK